MPINHSANFETIPLFDLQEFALGNPLDRQQFINQLRNVCHHIGFFYIKNHGVHIELMHKMLELTEAFFNLPQAEKDKINISFSPHYRGYGKLGEELTKGIRDYKETYDFGLEQAARQTSDEQPYLILQGPNQWPESETLRALRWKETVLEYIAAVQTAGTQIMSAMALTLGLPDNYFTDKFCPQQRDAYAILRLLRYPPGRMNPHSVEPELGVGPHTDTGCLVMLLQDTVGGLEVQNCRGEWIAAPPIDGTYVVNIGEMLQLWSNNYFLATPHRVINTSSRIRHSVPFFVEPLLSTVVTPLEISPELLQNMERPNANPATKVVYGDHMLHVYQRSFQ